MPVAGFWCERAWLPDGPAEHVLVRHDEHGTITEVAQAARPGAARRLAGLVFPGFANVHSHAFHRALRGRTHGAGGTFWTWRELMYDLAGRLDPDGYYRLARLVYAEMLLAGYTAVGEFHYLHHGPDGTRYADPNAMSAALVAAATDAGIRLTLLDTCYLTGGIGVPLAGVQRRFGDGDVHGWLARVAEFRPEQPDVRLGAALHSVRAVPPEAVHRIADWAGDRLPLHFHLSEQPAENQQCLAAYGHTPTDLLHEQGALRPSSTAVHATQLSEVDIAQLGSAGVTVGFCPTTEADLADGIGPARELVDAGCRLALGSDQHAVIDPFAEIRALEYGERLGSGRRGRFSPVELVAAATERGHASLGRAPAGRIAVGAPCDLVELRTDTPRTAGALAEQVPLAAGAADVRTVIVDGEPVVGEGRHLALDEVGMALAEVIGKLWS